MRNANVKKVDSLDVLIVALCRDFPRRAEAIKKGNGARRTLTEYRYLNFKIFEAVSEVVERPFVMPFIMEIGENIGYANSKIGELSERAYKTRKKLVKENIAKKLHLSD